MKNIRLAVIGAGHMGRRHAEKVVQLLGRGVGVSLQGVADLELGRARRVTAELGGHATTDFHALLGQIDAAIVAVPTVDHFKVVSDLLRAGCDVLVEKPIAATMKEARELVDLASAGNRILQVGHLEWFNSALQKVRGRIRRPRFIEAQRMGPFPDRAIDIDVVRDLMVHDLDILQQLLGEEPNQVEAVGFPVLTGSIDFANARLRYPSGCVANLTASRVSTTAAREIRFFEGDGHISVDLLTSSVRIVERERRPGGLGPRVRVEDLAIDRGDALLAQLEAFIGVVHSRTPPASVGAGGGDEALGALRTALRVLAAMDAIDPLE